MSNLIVAILIAVIFVGLAVRYWTNNIGAGPYILIVGLVFLLAFGGWAWSRDRDEAERAKDAAAIAEETYKQASIDHQRDVDEYDKCLVDAGNRVITRDTLRDQFVQQAENLKTAVLEILPNSDEARTAMDTYVRLTQESIDATYAPYVLPVEQGKCIRPGPAPIDPSPEDQ